MKSQRIKNALIFTGITVTAAYLLQFFTGVYYQKDLLMVLGRLRIFNIIVVVLILVTNALCWRVLKNLDGVLNKLGRGADVTEGERNKARQTGFNLILIITVTTIIAFFLGPVAGMIANSMAKIAAYTPVDFALILLINISTGLMAATHCILSIENMLHKPLSRLGLKYLDDKDKYVSLRGRFMLAAISSIMLTLSLLTAAAYGYIRFFERTASTVQDFGPALLLEIAVLFILIGGWCLWVFNTLASRVTRRLEKMTQQIEELAQVGGNLSYRRNISRNDNIDRISSALNKFLSTLESLVRSVKTQAFSTNESSQTLDSNASRAQGQVEVLTAAVEQVQQAVDEQNMTVEEARACNASLSESIEQVAAMMTDQAGFVEQSSAAISEMAASIGNASRTAAAADELATQLTEYSKEGDEKLAASVNAIKELDVVSKNVSEVITTISKITAQTNLLAMNAAIEAAHAGEAGKGFAVVANEVRSLANSASVSTRKTAELIRDMSLRISNAVESADNASESYQKISKGVLETTEMVNLIAASMSEQKTAVDEILSSTQSLTSATETIKQHTDGQRDKSGKMEQAMNQLILNTANIMEAMRKETDSITSLVQVVSDVQNEAVQNTRNMDELLTTVSRFTLSDSGTKSA